MNSKRLLAAAAVIAIAATVFTATSASAVGTLDYSSELTGQGYYSTAFSGNNVSRTFTAGATGTLDRVTLGLARQGLPGTFYVEVYATAAGAKTGTAVASEALLDSVLTTSFATVIVDFTTPTKVEVGTVYALVLRAPSGSVGQFGGVVNWGNGYNGLAFASYVTPFSSAVLSSSAVTTGVTAGVRTATLGTAAFSAVAFSHTAQHPTTTATLTIDDLTGANAGWNVTEEASDLTWTAVTGGPTTGADIRSVDLAITTVGPVETTGGYLWDGNTATGSLDSPVRVLSTTGGNGSYRVPLTLTLTIPGQAAVGTYTGTITTTISAAP